ncbi:glycosyltransferase family 2 protein [Cohnella lupini]|uniref:Glycosyltransferase involved in cell wall biosynthesis n=1 Tax=Cohnella lupini TaxID=1294267 RepID=A0A3D9I7E7_9BACL|nr:glycosyltransferase [Cohnella lupini]RED57600.1 glycosyltransferase involved in cell wall biosynthesis [Cohnella lupini]
MKKIALVVIALNEETKIRRCLESAIPFVDEMVVVDTGSIDRTKEIAREIGAKIYDYQWNNDFAAARNFSLSCSTADWFLVLDADEWIESFDEQAIRRFINVPSTVGRIKRVSQTTVNGDVTETNDYITRFFPQGEVYKGRIHEQVDTSLSRCHIPIVIQHDGYLESNKSDRNIPLLLLEIEDNPEDPYYLFQLAKEYNGLERSIESESYFARAYSLLHGKERYAPNVVTEYIYLLNKLKKYSEVLAILERNHEWLRLYPDFHFACGVFYLDLILSDTSKYISKLASIEQSYQWCLEIGETEHYDSVKGTGSFAAYYNLGNYYEVLGDLERAVICYRNSADLGYRKAEQRLLKMNEE